MVSFTNVATTRKFHIKIIILYTPNCEITDNTFLISAFQKYIFKAVVINYSFKYRTRAQKHKKLYRWPQTSHFFASNQNTGSLSNYLWLLRKCIRCSVISWKQHALHTHKHKFWQTHQCLHFANRKNCPTLVQIYI